MRFGNVTEGEQVDFPTKARQLVMASYNNTLGGQVEPLQFDETYVVWFAYTLGNWKALVSTMKADDRYYEVTHDKNGRTFIDTYMKIHNAEVLDG